MRWSPLNVFIQLAFGGILLLGLLFLGIVWQRKDRKQIRQIGTALAAWVGAYLALVLVVSARSRERVLPLGQAKEFCGFFLDCHMGIRIFDVEVAETVGSGPNAHASKGVYYVVTAFVENSAREATLQLNQADVRIISDDGGASRRDAAAESALARDTSLGDPVEPGGMHPVTIVFDVPTTALNPRLLVTEGENLWPDRLFELFLAGNENSVFHAKTSFSLGAAAQPVPVSRPPIPEQDVPPR